MAILPDSPSLLAITHSLGFVIPITIFVPPLQPGLLGPLLPPVPPRQKTLGKHAVVDALGHEDHLHPKLLLDISVPRLVIEKQHVAILQLCLLLEGPKVRNLGAGIDLECVEIIDPAGAFALAELEQ